MNITDINLKELIEHETGEHFDRNNKICCPFHNEKTPSFSIKKMNDKYRFHCFGCGCHGDSIDFIREYKNMNYIEACNYLGIEADTEHNDIVTNIDKIKNFIANKQLKDKDNKPLKYIKTYVFKDAYGKVAYYKVKFKDHNNKSQNRYLSITTDERIKMERGCDELPYNYYNLLQGLKDDKPIFILEGEKDADSLQYMGYTSTSFKGVTKFDYSIFKDKIVYCIPDTGAPGEKYKDDLWYKLKDYVKEFNVIYPKDWDKAPDNYDITDWFKDNHTKNDFKIALHDPWDYKKSKFWRDVILKGTSYIPKKTWRNVEQILKHNNVNLRYNLITHEAEATGELNSCGDELIIDIQTLSLNNGLNVNKDLICDSILKISRKNKYNPFVDYLKTNKNDNFNLIDEVFNTITINSEFENKKDTYLLYFKTWLMNLISMSQNTKQKGLKSQGVLILQGDQGIRKSTFFKKIIRNNQWFKGEANIDTKKTDSIWQNTRYVLVELSEFDGMSKKDQESMKRFLSNELDVYRVPYGRCIEEHPRTTTFCATVNPRDFLKDKTGSRRFWVIPVEKCDIEALEKININEFWGAVYGLWCTGTVKDYLNQDETATLLQDNTAFNIETDISIAIDETFDFSQNRIAWKVYNLSEIADTIKIYKTKAIRNEFERRGFDYNSYRDNYMPLGAKKKKGFVLPNVDLNEAKRLIKDINNNPFIKEDKTIKKQTPVIEQQQQVMSWNT